MHYKHFSSSILFCVCLFCLLFSISEVAWGEPVWSAVKEAATGVEEGHFWPGLKKTSDQVLVLVAVTFDQVGIDLADVVSDGVTENGKALVVVSSMPMQFLHLKIVCQKVYIFFENSFLWHVKKNWQILAFMFYKVMPKKTDSQWNCFGVEYFKLKS